MSEFLALVRKQLGESRWLLGLSALALFGLAWLFVFATHRMEASLNPINQMRRAAMGRTMGGSSADGSSTSLEIMWWRHPIVILIVLIWPISRGSIAVAGELEKGSLDLVMSRPVSRSRYLAAHLASAFIGLCVLAGALILGNQIGNHYNVISTPPKFPPLLFPAMLVFALGYSVYGMTLLFSAIDIVRWRATLIGSTLPLLMFIAKVVSDIPDLTDWHWLKNVSIFTVYDPLEAVLKADQFKFNTGVLLGVGTVGVVVGFVAFNIRDLPSNT